MKKLVEFLGFALQVTASCTPAEPQFFNHKEGYGHPGVEAECEITEVVIDGTGIDILPLLSDEKLGDLEEAYMEALEADD